MPATPDLTLGEDGATHQILEDIGLDENVAGYDSDCTLRLITRQKQQPLQLPDYEGPVYLRFGRPVWPIFTKEDGTIL